MPSRQPQPQRQRQPQAAMASTSGVDVARGGFGADAHALLAARPPSGGRARRVLTVEEAQALHELYMHRGYGSLARMLNVSMPPNLPVCPVCRLNKSTRVPHPSQIAQRGIAAKSPGLRTHVDTAGPLTEALYFEGCRYVVNFTDEFSRVELGVFCVDRTAATLIEAFKVYVAFMRSLGVTHVAEFLSDGGPEYVSREFYDFCDDHAIKRLLSVRYTPQQNGLAESRFRVHFPRVRTAINGSMSDLPHRARMWALAYQYSQWQHHRLPLAVLDGRRPFDLVPSPPLDGDLSHARPFGARMWVHKPDTEREGKLGETARAAVFVGMSELYKGYLAYYPESHEFEACHNVTWDVSEFPLRAAAVGPVYPDLPPLRELPAAIAPEAVRFRAPAAVPDPSTGPVLATEGAAADGGDSVHVPPTPTTAGREAGVPAVGPLPMRPAARARRTLFVGGGEGGGAAGGARGRVPMARMLVQATARAAERALRPAVVMLAMGLAVAR